MLFFILTFTLFLSPFVFVLAFFSPVLFALSAVVLSVGYFVKTSAIFVLNETDRIITYDKSHKKNKVTGIAKALLGHLEQSRLDRCNLRGLCLKDTNLDSTSMKHANLNAANLERASLKKVVLNFAKIVKTNLKNANLKHAWLRNANLNRSNLIGANLSWANLCGANLNECKVENTRFYGALFNENTKLPFSFDEALLRNMLFVTDSTYNGHPRA